MEIILLLMAAALMLYFYLKDDGSKNNSKPNNTSYKNNGSSSHNYQKNYGVKKYDVPLIETNKLIIEDALRKSKKISFRYRDKSDQITSRTVTPQRIFLYAFDEKEGKMLCLEAFCHLRNSNRTFALFRMSQVELSS
jgi:hypothetical protein